jgi:hypothetical protein
MLPLDVPATIKQVCPVGKQFVDDPRKQSFEGLVGRWKNGMDVVPLGNRLSRSESCVEAFPIENDDTLDEI